MYDSNIWHIDFLNSKMGSKPTFKKGIKKIEKSQFRGAGQSANNGSQNLRMQLILYPVFFPLKKISFVLASIRRIIFWRLDWEFTLISSISICVLKYLCWFSPYTNVSFNCMNLLLSACVSVSCHRFSNIQANSSLWSTFLVGGGWGPSQHKARKRGKISRSDNVSFIYSDAIFWFIHMYLPLKHFCDTTSLIISNGPDTSVILVLICCDMNFCATAIWYA